MKLTLLFLAFALISVFPNAQTLSLSNDYTTFSPGETLYIWGDSGQYNTIYCYLHVTNNTASNMDVLVKKTEVNVLPGTENSFCWGQCYPPAVYVSPDFVTINAGQTDLLSFSGDYLPKSQLGQSTIQYTFYNNANANDSVAIIVVYGSGTASINDFEDSPILTAYPNPVTSVANFTYQTTAGKEKAQLIIMSVTGSEVFRRQISTEGAPVSIDMSNINPGIYFYSVLDNGQATEMRKFVVVH